MAAPAQDIIRYESKVFTSGFGDQKTKYMGNSFEADAEWLKLYPRTVVRIPKSQADRLANKSIPIAGDEDHFPVLITAFHQLHCLDSIVSCLFNKFMNISDFYSGTCTGGMIKTRISTQRSMSVS